VVFGKQEQLRVLHFIQKAKTVATYPTETS